VLIDDMANGQFALIALKQREEEGLGK